LSNLFEAIINSIKVSTDYDTKHPLHTGEVTGCWVYYTAIKEFLRFEEAGLNTTNDDELIEMLKDAHKVCSSQVEIIENFMIQEGIPLPELPSPKTNSSNKEVPLGVKLTDDEIANGVGIKVATAIINSAAGQAQSVRNDFGQMMLRFNLEMVTFGSTLKSLMRKRGWLRIPPYYIPPGSPPEK
jgi:Protein of unknown function (DUF3231)